MPSFVGDYRALAWVVQVLAVLENKCRLRFRGGICSEVAAHCTQAHVSCPVSCFDDILLVIAESVGDHQGLPLPFLISFFIFF